MRISLLTALALAASEPGVQAAKPELAKIEITGGGLTAPVAITEPRIVRSFSLWTGPGTSEGWRAHPRAIIDWPKREATERPAGLRQFEVRFYWDVSREPVYGVAYAFEPRKEGGFIYLSADYTSTIVHGVEGRWFHSSAEWERVLRPYLERAARSSP